MKAKLTKEKRDNVTGSKQWNKLTESKLINQIKISINLPKHFNIP